MSTRDLSESFLLVDLSLDLSRCNTVFVLVAQRFLQLLQLLQLLLNPSIAQSMLVQAGQDLRVTLLASEASLVEGANVLGGRAFGLAHHLTDASVFDHYR